MVEPEPDRDEHAPKSSLSWRLKSAYAASARAAGRGLSRVGVLPETVPSRSHRWQHWLTSLTRVHDSMAIAELSVPWWTYGAIDEVEAWLESRDPVTAFEWGSGASTLWLAERVQSLVSVEHHREFADLIDAAVAQHDGVTVEMIPPTPSSDPRIGSDKAGYQDADFYDYVHAIDEAGSFDLILIDGRARAACLQRAIPHLAADGLIVFDNTLRRRYRDAVVGSGLSEDRFVGLTPTLPYPDATSLLKHAR